MDEFQVIPALPAFDLLVLRGRLRLKDCRLADDCLDDYIWIERHPILAWELDQDPPTPITAIARDVFPKCRLGIQYPDGTCLYPTNREIHQTVDAWQLDVWTLLDMQYNSAADKGLPTVEFEEKAR
jgi:hypothetical protein